MKPQTCWARWATAAPLSDWRERDQQWPLKSLCWLTSQSYRAWLAVTSWHNKHWQELSVSLFCLSLIHFQAEQLSFLPVALGILIWRGCFEYVIDSVLSVPRRKTCFHSDALLLRTASCQRSVETAPAEWKLSGQWHFDSMWSEGVSEVRQFLLTVSTPLPLLVKDDECIILLFLIIIFLLCVSIQLPMLNSFL